MNPLIRFIFALPLILVAMPAKAQVGLGGGQVGGPLTCSAFVPVPTVVRSEGISELLADFLVMCNGGVSSTAGSVVPTANFTVSLGTQITSRVLPNGGSEAMLIIDDPGNPAESGPGPALPQVLCDSPTLGAGAGGCVGSTPGAAGLYLNTSGAGLAASQCTAFSGPTCTSFGTTPNIFPGVVSGNQVSFSGIPVLAPVTGGFSRLFRITNVRANVAALGGGPGVQQLQASVA